MGRGMAGHSKSLIFKSLLKRLPPISCHTRNHAGLSLIELLVASAVLTVLILATAVFYQNSIKNNQSNQAVLTRDAILKPIAMVLGRWENIGRIATLEPNTLLHRCLNHNGTTTICSTYNGHLRVFDGVTSGIQVTTGDAVVGGNVVVGNDAAASTFYNLKGEACNSAISNDPNLCPFQAFSSFTVYCGAGAGKTLPNCGTTGAPEYVRVTATVQMRTGITAENVRAYANLGPRTVTYNFNSKTGEMSISEETFEAEIVYEADPSKGLNVGDPISKFITQQSELTLFVWPTNAGNQRQPNNEKLDIQIISGTGTLSSAEVTLQDPASLGKTCPSGKSLCAVAVFTYTHPYVAATEDATVYAHSASLKRNPIQDTDASVYLRTTVPPPTSCSPIFLAGQSTDDPSSQASVGFVFEHNGIQQLPAIPVTYSWEPGANGYTPAPVPNGNSGSNGQEANVTITRPGTSGACSTLRATSGAATCTQQFCVTNRIQCCQIDAPTLADNMAPLVANDRGRGTTKTRYRVSYFGAVNGDGSCNVTTPVDVPSQYATAITGQGGSVATAPAPLGPNFLEITRPDVYEPGSTTLTISDTSQTPNISCERIFQTDPTTDPNECAIVISPDPQARPAGGPNPESVVTFTVRGPGPENTVVPYPNQEVFEFTVSDNALGSLHQLNSDQTCGSALDSNSKINSDDNGQVKVCLKRTASTASPSPTLSAKVRLYGGPPHLACGPVTFETPVQAAGNAYSCSITPDNFTGDAKSSTEYTVKITGNASSNEPETKWVKFGRVPNPATDPLITTAITPSSQKKGTEVQNSDPPEANATFSYKHEDKNESFVLKAELRTNEDDESPFGACSVNAATKKGCFLPRLKTSSLRGPACLRTNGNPYDYKVLLNAEFSSPFDDVLDFFFTPLELPPGVSPALFWTNDSTCVETDSRYITGTRTVTCNNTFVPTAPGTYKIQANVINQCGHFKLNDTFEINIPVCKSESDFKENAGIKNYLNKNPTKSTKESEVKIHTPFVKHYHINENATVGQRTTFGPNACTIHTPIIGYNEHHDEDPLRTNRSTKEDSYLLATRDTSYGQSLLRDARANPTQETFSRTKAQYQSCGSLRRVIFAGADDVYSMIPRNSLNQQNALIFNQVTDLIRRTTGNEVDLITYPNTNLNPTANPIFPTPVMLVAPPDNDEIFNNPQVFREEILDDLNHITVLENLPPTLKFLKAATGETNDVYRQLENEPSNCNNNNAECKKVYLSFRFPERWYSQDKSKSIGPENICGAYVQFYIVPDNTTPARYTIGNDFQNSAAFNYVSLWSTYKNYTDQNEPEVLRKRLSELLFPYEDPNLQNEQQSFNHDWLNHSANYQNNALDHRKRLGRFITLDLNHWPRGNNGAQNLNSSFFDTLNFEFQALNFRVHSAALLLHYAKDPIKTIPDEDDTTSITCAQVFQEVGKAGSEEQIKQMKESLGLLSNNKDYQNKAELSKALANFDDSSIVINPDGSVTFKMKPLTKCKPLSSGATTTCGEFENSTCDESEKDYFQKRINLCQSATSQDSWEDIIKKLASEIIKANNSREDKKSDGFKESCNGACCTSCSKTVPCFECSLVMTSTGISSTKTQKAAPNNSITINVSQAEIAEACSYSEKTSRQLKYIEQLIEQKEQSERQKKKCTEKPKCGSCSVCSGGTLDSASSIDPKSATMKSVGCEKTCYSKECPPIAERTPPNGCSTKAVDEKIKYDEECDILVDEFGNTQIKKTPSKSTDCGSLNLDYANTPQSCKSCACLGYINGEKLPGTDYRYKKPNGAGTCEWHDVICTEKCSDDPWLLENESTPAGISCPPVDEGCCPAPKTGYPNCACPDPDLKQSCKSDPDKRWDDTKCTCSCRNKLSCSDVQFFDPNSCDCMCDPVKLTAKCASQNQQPNFSSCSCTGSTGGGDTGGGGTGCTPKTCPNNKFWNPVKCDCECKIACPPGETQDPSTCGCSPAGGGEDMAGPDNS